MCRLTAINMGIPTRSVKARAVFPHAGGNIVTTVTESFTGYAAGLTQGVPEVALFDVCGRHAPAFEPALSEAVPLVNRATVRASCPTARI